MKAVITKASRVPFHAIHFSAELPLIIMGNSFYWHRNREPLSRAHDLGHLSTSMVEINSGRFHREIVNAKAAYREYLSDLLMLPGLEYVHRSGRYQIEVLTGLCFDAASVCREIASVVHKHFYSESELQIDTRLTDSTTDQGDLHVHV